MSEATPTGGKRRRIPRKQGFATYPFEYAFFEPFVLSRFSEQAETCSPWFSLDSEQKFEINGHDYYGPEDIEYRFNASGYRSNPFVERKAFNVIIAGCSHTFGTGLAWPDTYGEVLRRELERLSGRDTQVWNLGLPGRSNDAIARTLIGAVTQHRPDAVFVYWSGRGRREIFTRNQQSMHLGPYSFRGAGEFEDLQADDRRLVIAMKELASDGDNQVNALKNMKTVEFLCRAEKIFHLCGSIHATVFAGIEDHLDPATLLGFRMEKNDRARDNMHPGRQSNQAFGRKLAADFWSRYRAWPGPAG